MIKNILFDFGGVMITLFTGGIIYVEEKHNFEKGYIYEKIKYVVVDYAKGLIDTFGFRKGLIENLGKELGEEVFERWGHRENMAINYNMIEFVLKLKENGYKCYLLSDTNEIHKQSNEIKHVYDIFDELILSCDIGICKREDTRNGTSKFFDYALERLGILPEESIFIDDLQENCKAANRAGIQTIWAQNPQQVIDDLSSILKLD